MDTYIYVSLYSSHCSQFKVHIFTNRLIDGLTHVSSGFSSLNLECSNASRLLFFLLSLPRMLFGTGCRVCAVCGAEAARASQVATIEIHPSIHPDHNGESGFFLFFDG